jgi:ribosomal protein S1
MKKTIAIVLSLVLMFAFSAATFAAEKAAAPAEKKAAPAKAAKKQVTGEVTAVDAKANTLTVKGKAGDVMLSTDDKTKVMAGKDKKALADVKVGDKVTVKYTEAEGKNVAHKVSITAAPAKKETTMEKKEAAPAAAPAEKKAAPAKKSSGY